MPSGSLVGRPGGDSFGMPSPTVVIDIRRNVVVVVTIVGD